ncbi:MAG TPA: hypothetical protein VI322_02225 [Candidatus Saccharimonadia bacterium]
MNSAAALFAFLVVALVGGVMLMAVVASGSKKHRRGGGSRGGSGHGPAYVAQPKLSREQVRERWATIEAMAAGGGPGLRQAIQEADKLLDLALRQAGAHGDTMGERLKSAKSKFTNYSFYDGAWRAHKLRNALAHEVGFDLVPSQAREALQDFKFAINDLGAM